MIRWHLPARDTAGVYLHGAGTSEGDGEGCVKCMRARDGVLSIALGRYDFLPLPAWSGTLHCDLQWSK